MPGERKVAPTESTARRFAAATLAYEAGDRNMPPIKFRQPADDGANDVRLCKTTAEWAVNTIATLDIWESGVPPAETKSTGQTLDAVNKTKKVQADVFVIVAKGATGKWYLVEAAPKTCENTSTKAIEVSSSASDSSSDAHVSPGDGVQVLVNNGGCMKWVHTTEITYITSVALESGGLVFQKKKAWVLDSTNTADATTINSTDCTPPA